MTKTFILSILFLINCYSVDLKPYMSLKNPRIEKKASLMVLQVTYKGDPNITASKAYSRLFDMRSKLKNNSLSFSETIPLARWPIPLETPIEEYVGIYAIPVSDVSELPATLDNEEPRVTLESWKYETPDSMVGEILHIGSYDNEMPTIQRLKDYLKENGYEISGVHEEEYLKGPGMFFKGDENEYATILRYPVKQIKRKK